MAKLPKIQCSGKAYAPAKKKKAATPKLPKVLGPKPKPPKKPDVKTPVKITQDHEQVQPYINDIVQEFADAFGLKTLVESSWCNPPVTYTSIDTCTNKWDKFMEQTLGTREYYSKMASLVEKWEQAMPGIDGTKNFTVDFTYCEGIEVYYTGEVYKDIDTVVKENAAYEKAKEAYDKKLATWEAARKAGVPTKEEVDKEKKVKLLAAKKAKLEAELKKLEQAGV